MSLSISNNGLTLIKSFEGCRLTAYKAVSTEKYWTIGWGHYGQDVKQGQIITQAQADNYLRSDCGSAEKAVNSYMDKYNWNQNQFDALVSFTFNCGSGNLKTLLNNGQRTIAEISAKITAYNKSGGKVLQGLVKRRAVEKELFDKPVSSVSAVFPPTSTSTTIKFTIPISYLQTDPKWKNHNYSAKGEKKTIGSAGCGVTATAMVIATLKDKNVTPITTAEWSMAHGYKALNQGTYYTYFVPQFKQYGITCRQLNSSNLYGKSSSSAHTEALNALKKGNWIIAVMGKGHWTSAGHFILLYKYENGYVYINDPASTKADRIKNTWDLFSKQVRYMWIIDVPDSFKTGITSPVVSTTVPNSNSYSQKQFIKDVQAAIGAKVDGIAGTETLSKTVTISKSKNNRHAVVKPLQKYLNFIGFNCGTTDGVAGLKFDSAVKSYQKKNNCIVDGEITKSGNTWKKLLGLK